MIKTYEELKLKTGVIISATNTSGSQKVDAIMELFTQPQKVEVGNKKRCEYELFVENYFGITNLPKGKIFDSYVDFALAAHQHFKTGDVRKVYSGNVFIEREIKSYGLPKKTGKYIYKDKWGSFGECVYAYPPSTINESWDSKYPVSWLEPLPQGEGYSVEDCQCGNKGDFTLIAGYSYCNKCGKRC